MVLFSFYLERSGFCNEAQLLRLCFEGRLFITLCFPPCMCGSYASIIPVYFSSTLIDPRTALEFVDHVWLPSRISSALTHPYPHFPPHSDHWCRKGFCCIYLKMASIITGTWQTAFNYWNALGCFDVISIIGVSFPGGRFEIWISPVAHSWCSAGEGVWKRGLQNIRSFSSSLHHRSNIPHNSPLTPNRCGYVLQPHFHTPSPATAPNNQPILKTLPFQNEKTPLPTIPHQ